MRIIQKIEISGNNWNDLINLPCVESLSKGKLSDIISVHLRDKYLPEKWQLKSMPSFKENLERIKDLSSPMWQRVNHSLGRIGDTLVEFENHTWEIQKRNGGGVK